MRFIGYVVAFVLLAAGAEAGLLPACSDWQTGSHPDRAEALVFGHGRFVTPGFISEDGIVWRGTGTEVLFTDAIWDGTRFVAVNEQEVLTSRNGISWSTMSPDPSGGRSYIAWNGEIYVLVSTWGSIYTSTDLLSWSLVHDSPELRLHRVRWLDNRFLAIGDAVLTSTNGESWDTADIADRPPSSYLMDVAWSGERYLAVGYHEQSISEWAGFSMYSFDGLTWHAQSGGGSFVVWDGAQFIITEYRDARAASYPRNWVYTSTDGTEWHRRFYGLGSRATGLVVGNGRRVVVRDNGGVLSSRDGISWHDHQIAPPWESLIDMTWDGTRYLVVGTARDEPFPLSTYPKAYYSHDGLVWYGLRAISSSHMPSIGGIASDGGTAVVAGGDGGEARIYAIPAQGEPSSISLPGTGHLSRVTWTGTRFIAVGEQGSIVTSADGVEWMAETSGTTADLRGVAHRGGSTVAVGLAGTIVVSHSQGVWAAATSPAVTDLGSVAAGARQWVVVGHGGTVLISSDGDSWHEQDAGTSADLYQVAAADYGFITVGGSIMLAAGTDGTGWQTVSPPTASDLHDVLVRPGVELVSSSTRIWQRRCPSLSIDDAAAVLPAAVHAAGAHGSLWQSNALIHNPGASLAEVDLYLLGLDDSSTEQPVTLIMPPFSSAQLPDILYRQLQVEDGSAALAAVTTQPIMLGSRCLTTAGTAGTYGQGIPGRAPSQALTSGERATLIQLSGGPQYRTNFGFSSRAPVATTVDLELFRDDGTSLGSRAVTLQPYGFSQLNDLLSGSGDAGAAYAVVHSGHARARYFTYASVVDNRTGDPAYLEPAAAADSELWLPAAAHTRGQGGTAWRTDLDLYNPGPGPAEVAIELLPAQQNNFYGGPVAHITVAASSVVRIEDLLAALFQHDGVAALRLVPLSGRVAASSRTYNLAAEGSYGQTIPAVPEVALGGEEIRLPLPVAGSPGLRINVGVLNPERRQNELRIELVDGAGAQLGSLAVSVPPLSLVQLNDVSEKLARPDAGITCTIVRPARVGNRFYAYASLVDQDTGDPTFVGCSECGS
jgi:hypothetical protein